MAGSDRRFTDEEVREILARAADRQDAAERSRSLSPSRHGLTLAQLRSVAEEAGIAPDHVETAARELMRRAEAPGPLVAGAPAGPRVVAVSRVVPAPLTEAAWERVVRELRTTFKKNGIVTSFGDAREWCSANEVEAGMAAFARVEPTPEGTVVDLHQDLSQAYAVPAILGGSFLAVAAIVLVLMAVGDFATKAFLAPMMMAGLAAVSGVGGWAVARVWAVRKEEEFRGLADRIDLLIRTEANRVT